VAATASTLSSPCGGIAELERLSFALWDYLPPDPEQGELLFSFGEVIAGQNPALCHNWNHQSAAAGPKEAGCEFWDCDVGCVQAFDIYAM